MARRSEYYEARDEILRRCSEAGLDGREMQLLLWAFEAGALRSWARAAEANGDLAYAQRLRHCASGVRPRGWRRLLPAKQVKAGAS